MPRLNALHESFEGEGLVIVGVTNEEEQLVAQTVEKTAMAYPVALTPGDEADRAYGITAVPRSFLIDREGVLVWAGHPSALEESRLRELIRRR